MVHPASDARRVLIVDRDARVRVALAALIDATPGFEVAAMIAPGPDVDRIACCAAATVAVVDIDAARADDDLATITSLAGHLPVVAVCVATGAGARAVTAGASAFCDKGADPDCLIAAVAAAARRPPTAEVARKNVKRDQPELDLRPPSGRRLQY